MKFKETLIDVKHHEEIDLFPPFYNEDTEEFNEIDTTEIPEDSWIDTVSMDINDAIKTLAELKANGANRVYIYAHVDHVGYIFTGVRLEEVK